MPDAVFKDVMGRAFERIPTLTRIVHTPHPARRFVGRAQVRRGRNPIARLLAHWMGLPPAGDGVPVEVSVREENGREIKTRDYDGRVFQSAMVACDTPDGPRVMETVGAITTRMRIEERPDGLNLHAERAYLGQIALPAWLSPTIKASERAYGGAHLFDVTITMPLIGLIVAFRGRLVEQRSA